MHKKSDNHEGAVGGMFGGKSIGKGSYVFREASSIVVRELGSEFRKGRRKRTLGGEGDVGGVWGGELGGGGTSSFQDKGERGAEGITKS